MNDNPFGLLDEIGRLVEEMDDFNISEYYKLDQLTIDNHAYGIVILKFHDLTVLQVERFGVDDGSRRGLVVSIHWENEFTLFPILLLIESKEEAEDVLREVIRLLEVED